jgi:hypothetical protein
MCLLLGQFGCLALLVAGCGAVSSQLPMRPERSSLNKSIDDFAMAANRAEELYNCRAVPTLCTTQDSTGFAPAGASDTALRDVVISNKILASDLAFEKLSWATWAADAGVATGADWAVLGLTAAGSLSPVGAAQALAGTAAAVTGAKTSLQKNFLYSKTVDQLLFAMTVNRAQIRTHILKCMKLPDSVYSLALANIDLEQYQNAENLPLTIANLTSTVNSAKPEDWCDMALPDQASKTVATPSVVGPPAQRFANPTVQSFSTIDPAAKSLSRWLRPTAVREDKPGHWVDAAGRGAPPDDIRLTKLNDWITKNVLPNPPFVTVFMTSPVYAKYRQQAVADLTTAQ